MVCDPSKRDLAEFHRGGHFKARRGGHGEGSQRHGADADTLEVEGEEQLSVYTARAQDRGQSERNFCKFCGSFLWLFNPIWPKLVHPYASAIDTPLPQPPEHVRLMLHYAAPWCEIPTGENEKHFLEFPEESLAEWHQRQGLLGP